MSAFSWRWSNSVQVLANQACKLKHGDLTLAKNGLEFVISIDIAFVDFVLESMFLDIGPEFFHNFSAR